MSRYIVAYGKIVDLHTPYKLFEIQNSKLYIQFIILLNIVVKINNLRYNGFLKTKGFLIKRDDQQHTYFNNDIGIDFNFINPSQI